MLGFAGRNTLILLMLDATMRVGGACVLIMLCHSIIQWVRGRRPGAAVLVFTGAVLSEVIARWSYNRCVASSPQWVEIFEDRWKMWFWSGLIASVVLLAGSVVLSRNAPKTVKVCVWALLAIEAPFLLLLVLDLAGLIT